MIIVRLVRDDTRFKLKKDDLLEVTPYIYDSEKFVVIQRLSDGFNPKCNVYRNQVEIVKSKRQKL